MQTPVSEKTGTAALALCVSVAFLMEALDSTIVVAAIPAMAVDFGVEPLRLNLAVSLYLVALAATIPASGWIADRVGARRLFVWAMAGFALASLAASFSQNLTTLIGMRVAQAVCAGLMVPTGRLLLIRATPREQLAAAIAWMSMPALVGPVLGPLIGGYIVTYAAWPLIFLVNLPFACIGIVWAWRLLPTDEPSGGRPFDIAGFLCCAIVLAGAQIGLDQFVHPYLSATGRMVLAVIILASLLAFTLHLRRADAPVLDFTLMHRRLFQVAIIAGGLSRIGLNAVPFLLQLQLQLGFGRSAAQAGWIVLVIAASALLLKPMMRVVLARFGFRHTLCGNAAFAAFWIAGFAFATPQTPLWLLVSLAFLFGVARSLQFNTANTLLYADIPRERQSAATTLGGVGQQLSMALGITLAAVLAAQFEALGAMLPAQAISWAFLCVAAVTAASAVLFLRLRPGDGAETSRHAPYLRKT